MTFPDHEQGREEEMHISCSPPRAGKGTLSIPPGEQESAIPVHPGEQEKTPFLLTSVNRKMYFLCILVNSKSTFPDIRISLKRKCTLPVQLGEQEKYHSLSTPNEQEKTHFLFTLVNRTRHVSCSRQ